jgi:CheY-like chemotaxis protein
VLVADDRPANRMVLDGLISRMGHRVEVVNNGREAVDAHARGGFDLILLDIEMPVMDGYGAAAEIRLHEGSAARRTPIIAATAYAMEEERRRCLAAGMDDFITKPITMMALRDVFDRFG